MDEHLEYHPDSTLYVERIPDAGIELREETGQIIIDGIREGLADPGSFSGHIECKDLETRTYRRDTLMVILPPDYPVETHERPKLADIASYDNVGLPDGKRS